MSDVLRAIIIAVFTASCIAVVLGPVSGTVRAEPLRTIANKQPTDAELLEIDSSELLRFRSSVDQVATEEVIEAKNLFRWGQPPQAPLSPFLVLSDGSEIILDLPNDVETVESDRLFFHTGLFGDANVPLETIRGIVLAAPTEFEQRQKLIGRLLRNEAGPDEIVMINGDILRGRFVEMNENTVTFESDARRRIVTRKQIAMIVLDTKYAQQRTNSKPTMIVGFRDGHRLITDSVDMNSDDLILELLGGTTLASPSFVRPVEERVVQFIQPIGHKIVYISDLKPSGYKHIPYLSGHWPFQVDRDLQMRTLGSDRHRSAKGIAMHSASRLTFELNEGFTSFDSELGIADSETKDGSVVYRVFVRRSAQWTEAYKSPIVRIGDQPLLCSVPVRNADAISLVVDFADRADQGDHALWLDARLLRP